MSFLYAKSAEEAAIHHAKVAEQRRMLQEQMDAKAAAGGAATSSSDRTAGHGRRAQKLQDRQEEHPTGEIDMDHGFFAGFGAQQSATQQTGGRGRRAAFGRRAEAQQTPGREAPIQKAGIYAHLNVPNNVGPTSNIQNGSAMSGSPILGHASPGANPRGRGALARIHVTAQQEQAQQQKRSALVDGLAAQVAEREHIRMQTKQDDWEADQRELKNMGLPYQAASSAPIPDKGADFLDAAWQRDAAAAAAKSAVQQHRPPSAAIHAEAPGVGASPQPRGRGRRGRMAHSPVAQRPAVQQPPPQARQAGAHSAASAAVEHSPAGIPGLGGGASSRSPPPHARAAMVPGLDGITATVVAGGASPGGLAVQHAREYRATAQASPASGGVHSAYPPSSHSPGGEDASMLARELQELKGMVQQLAAENSNLKRGADTPPGVRQGRQGGVQPRRRGEGPVERGPSPITSPAQRRARGAQNGKKPGVIKRRAGEKRAPAVRAPSPVTTAPAPPSAAQLIDAELDAALSRLEDAAERNEWMEGEVARRKAKLRLKYAAKKRRAIAEEKGEGGIGGGRKKAVVAFGHRVEEKPKRPAKREGDDLRAGSNQGGGGPRRAQSSKGPRRGGALARAGAAALGNHHAPPQRGDRGSDPRGDLTPLDGSPGYAERRVGADSVSHRSRQQAESSGRPSRPATVAGSGVWDGSLGGSSKQVPGSAAPPPLFPFQGGGLEASMLDGESDFILPNGEILPGDALQPPSPVKGRHIQDTLAGGSRGVAGGQHYKPITSPSGSALPVRQGVPASGRSVAWGEEAPSRGRAPTSQASQSPGELQVDDFSVPSLAPPPTNLNESVGVGSAVPTLPDSPPELRIREETSPWVHPSPNTVATTRLPNGAISPPPAAQGTPLTAGRGGYRTAAAAAAAAELDPHFARSDSPEGGSMFKVPQGASYQEGPVVANGVSGGDIAALLKATVSARGR